MPTYEYRCPEGHEFEHFYRTMSAAESVLKCPVCGQEAQRKVSGGSGLVFKGSGFYITDYGKDGKKDLRRASGSSSAGEKKSSSDEGKPSSSSSDSEKKGTGKPSGE